MHKEKHRRIRLALSVWLLSMTLVVLSQANAKTLGEAFKEVNASVVEIRTVQRSVPHRVGMTPASVGGLGSGVLISSDRARTVSTSVYRIKSCSPFSLRPMRPQPNRCG